MKSQARLAIPAGVIAAGTIYNYSFPGLAWLVIALIAWALIVAWLERDEEEGLRLRQRLRWAIPVLAAGVAIPVIASLPELVNLVKFAGFEAFNPEGKGGNVGFGNLRQPLNPLEALGIWPSSEFRITPKNSTTPEVAFYLGGLLALAAFAWGVGRAIARREAALPAALVSAAIGYLAALAIGTPYTQAKALAVAAPVVMLIVLRGLLSADSLEEEGEKEASWWPPRRLRPLVRLGVPALTVAFAVAAACSRPCSPCASRRSGPRGRRSPSCATCAPRSTARTSSSSAATTSSPGSCSAPRSTPRSATPTTPSRSGRSTARRPINAKFDWDNVPPDSLRRSQALEDFDWVITTSADFNSEPPPEFEPVKATRDFVLWERVAPAQDPGAESRHTLREPIYPGSTVDCSIQKGRACRARRHRVDSRSTGDR